jgi:hypothetical protein
MTVLIIVILVPIVAFATTHFITSSLVRYTTQNRNMKALYLAQAGIHRAIYNIKAGVSPFLPVMYPDANNTITVTEVTPNTCGIYQLKSVGTSFAANYPTQISRTVFAQYTAATNTVNIYQSGDGTGVPVPPCCDQAWWPFSEGSGNTTGTAPYVGTRTGTAPNSTLPAWTAAGRVGNALDFNQAPATHNYVRVNDLLPGPSGLDLTTQGTLMAWIYISAQVNANAGIVHKGHLSDSSDEAYGLAIARNGVNRRLKFELRDDDEGVSHNLTPNVNLDRDTWYQVSGTWGPDGLRAYINGVQRASSSNVWIARTTDGSLQIGTRVTNSANTRFIGIIDEVYIYACQKTGDEIKAYYNSTCAGSGATPCPQP